MKLGLKRLLQLRVRTGEDDQVAARHLRLDREPMALQPIVDLREILRRDAEPRAVFRRGQPDVIVGRLRILLVVGQLVERGLLRGAALEDQDGPPEVRVIDHGGDAGAGVDTLARCLRMECDRSEACEQKQEE